MQSFMRSPKRLLLGVAIPFFYLAAAESVRADSKVYQNLLHSTGLVEVPCAEGRITSKHSPRTTAKTKEPRRPTEDLALTNGPGRRISSALAQPAKGPSQDWGLATLLIGAMAVLLLLGKVHRHPHPTNSTVARTGEVKNGAPGGLFQDRCQTRG